MRVHPWQQQTSRSASLYSQATFWEKNVQLRQPKEWLLSSVYANHLNLVVIERPVNYFRAGVVLFAVYKQSNTVWLTLGNVASEDNRFRVVCTKACLSVCLSLSLCIFDYFSTVSFGLINTFSPFKSCLTWKVLIVEGDILHDKDLSILFAWLR